MMQRCGMISLHRDAYKACIRVLHPLDLVCRKDRPRLQDACQITILYSLLLSVKQLI